MQKYRGRFAPSPTGPLHMGSLLAALISYLDARKAKGQWLLRIEDIDPPREQSGARQSIVATLKDHGFDWNGEIRYQSAQSALYEQNLNTLARLERSYVCPCSRRQLAENGGNHLSNCGKYKISSHGEGAIRFRSSDNPIQWNDLLKGPQSITLNEDFILKRRDALYSYQLAVVSDDIDQGITHIIRGEDLLDSTPMQLELYALLGQTTPQFGHFPLIVNNAGQKLSKQNLAPAVDNTKVIDNLLTLGELLNLVSSPLDDNPRKILYKYQKQWKREKLNFVTAEQLKFS